MTRRVRCEVPSENSYGYTSVDILTYYQRVLARCHLRRLTGHTWTADCPDHATRGLHTLILNCENGSYRCSDRECDLSWGGRDIFFFEMARQRREYGSVPGCGFVKQAIDDLVGKVRA
jgi:hypothetical protein